MRIALIGYGKMGRTIEALGVQKGFSFPLTIDADNLGDLNAGKMRDIDVAIEFTIPSSAPKNVSACIELGIPVVSGTTGWNDRIEDIESLCKENNGTFFYASNFSIGVNILFAMNKQLARIMEQFPDYSASMEEVHHIHKLDAPSGTAISLADQIIGEQKKLIGWSLDDKNDPSRLPIRSIREGEVKGNHTITYESDLDSISLGHVAKTRDAFAAGVLLAASFLKDKKGVYGMNDLLNI